MASDVSPAVRDLAAAPKVSALSSQSEQEIRPDRGPDVQSRAFIGDAAVQAYGSVPRANSSVILSPLLTFEGLKNKDNPFLVAPPDPVGAVGPNHYVEMVNLVFAVYDKLGNRLTGPTPLGESLERLCRQRLR